MKIGFLGTGIMGGHMARRLAAAGASVHAWNRSAAKVEALAAHGVARVATPSEALDGSDIAIVTVLEEIRRVRDVTKTLRSHPIRGGGYLNKSMLVSIYKEMVAAGEIKEDAHLLERIRMKPMRTLSGVTTVTVLTKPYPCPGKCIFCPTDVRMPKSYLPDEPGAMRAVEHQFDPYDQEMSRITSCRDWVTRQTRSNC